VDPHSTDFTVQIRTTTQIRQYPKQVRSAEKSPDSLTKQLGHDSCPLYQDSVQYCSLFEHRIGHDNVSHNFRCTFATDCPNLSAFTSNLLREDTLLCSTYERPTTTLRNENLLKDSCPIYECVNCLWVTVGRWPRPLRRSPACSTFIVSIWLLVAKSMEASAATPDSQKSKERAVIEVTDGRDLVYPKTAR
jgi:hypothetical protein